MICPLCVRAPARLSMRGSREATARARGEEVFVSGALPYRTAARRPIHNSCECLTDTRVFTLVMAREDLMSAAEDATEQVRQPNSGF